MKKFFIAFFLSSCLLSLVACASTSNNESTGQYLDSAATTTKVKANIASAVGLKTLDSISVTTYKGVVQLSGFVKSQKDINQAVSVAKKVPGVKSIENSLLVRKKMK